MTRTLNNYAATYIFLTHIVGLIAIPFLLIVDPSYFWISLVVYFFTGCLGMSITFHRALAHGGHKWMPKWFVPFGTLCGTYGLTGSSIAWCAQHRTHHVFTDKKEDPHSPHWEPWYLVQFASMFKQVPLKHAGEILKSPFHQFLHRNYFLIHLAIVAGLLLFGGPILLAAAYLVPNTILWHAGSAVNTINHLWGYENYNNQDCSRNNALTGYLVWGEGWHNNHHNTPTKLYFGEKWWEFDIGGAIALCLLKIR